MSGFCIYVELLLLTVTNNSVVLLRSSVLFILQAIFRSYSTLVLSLGSVHFAIKTGSGRYLSLISIWSLRSLRSLKWKPTYRYRSGHWDKFQRSWWSHRLWGSHSPAIAAMVAAAKFEKLPQWIQDTLLRVNHFETAEVDPKWSELRPPGQPVLFYSVCIKVKIVELQGNDWIFHFVLLHCPNETLTRILCSEKTIDALLISLA